jgi:hypothetical protein
MLDKFPQSKELKKIIESHGWTLYNSTIPKERKFLFTFEEYQKKSPAEEFVTGNNYFFIPIPNARETLRKAYSHTQGLGPCIQLDYLAQHKDMDGEGAHLVDGKITYIFTRLAVEPHMNRDTIGLFTPSNAMSEMPILGIPFEYVLEKFQKHFRIISPEEYWGGLELPNIRSTMN